MHRDFVRFCVAALALAGCATQQTPRVPDAPTPHFDREPSVAHLDQASRLPLIERDARLIAAYVEMSDMKDAKERSTFLVFTQTGQIAHHDGPKNDQPGTPDLDQRVDSYLTHGRWVSMHAGAPEKGKDGPAWSLGGGLHFEFYNSTETEIANVGIFRDDSGRTVGIAGEGVHGVSELKCDRSNMLVKSIAYDPPTHMVWVNWMDPDGTDRSCEGGYDYIQVFYYFDPCAYDPSECPARAHATP